MVTEKNERLLHENPATAIVPARNNDRQNKPVTLNPSWEDNDLPEDELNFKSVAMDVPPDRFNIIYFTFLLHGIGVLIPWNMFITATGYFVSYKLGKDYVGEELKYAVSFLQYVTFAAQIPNITFNWLNIFVQIGGDLTTRIVWSLIVNIVLFVLTIGLAMADTSTWPGAFFWITMITVVFLNMATGIYQNTIFGLAAKFPFKYTSAIILGNNICGTFVTLCNIIFDIITDKPRLSATYYFIIALFVLLVCFDSYFALPLNKFFRYHDIKNKKEERQQKSSNTPPPYWQIFKKAAPQCINVFLVFFVTLSVFPAVSANIAPNAKDHFLGKYYVAITCFLTFNFTAMVGSILPGFFIWPKPNYVWIPVVLRFIYIPFYLLCNYRVGGKRAAPVLFGDAPYWLVGTTMGVTSGYFSSISMIYASTTADPEHAGYAGQFAAAFLISGIFMGIVSSFIWPYVVV